MIVSRDGGEIVVSQNHVSRLPADVGPRSPHGNPNVGPLESHCVVRSVPRHGHYLTQGLERLSRSRERRGSE